MIFFPKSPTRRQCWIVHGKVHVDRLFYEEFVIDADSNVAETLPGICLRTLREKKQIIPKRPRVEKIKIKNHLKQNQVSIEPAKHSSHSLQLQACRQLPADQRHRPRPGCPRSTWSRAHWIRILHYPHWIRRGSLQLPYLERLVEMKLNSIDSSQNTSHKVTENQKGPRTLGPKPTQHSLKRS